MLRYKTLLIVLLLCVQSSYGQSNDVWVRFMDTTTNLCGYRDLKGVVKVPARLAPYGSPDSFYHIITAIEPGVPYKSYFLLKDGRKVAHDSVYTFDEPMTLCESEGKILFSDNKKDRVGYLDSNGKVLIPALYNEGSPFRNGLAIVLRNGVKKCADERDSNDCEHWGWSGAEELLINEKNEILADSVDPYLYGINWYSLRINDPTVDTSVYRQISGRNGNVYSFMDYYKEFRRWFYTHFLTEACAGREQFTSLCFPEITYWSEHGDWSSLAANSFFKTFPVSFDPERFRETDTRKVSISSDDLYHDGVLLRRYYNACGEHNRDRYPVFSVSLQYFKKRTTPYVKSRLDPRIPTIAGATEEEWEPSEFEKNYEADGSEAFHFIRTEKGYQLYQVSLRK